MFRSPRMLTLSCPLRSLLLREYYAATCSDHAGVTWQAARALKERSNKVIHRCKKGSLCFRETLQCSTQLPLLSSDSEDEKRRETSFKNLTCKAFLSFHCPQCPQVSAAAKAKQEFSSWNCTVVKDLTPNSLISSSYLQSRRRPVCQTLSSLTAKTCKLLHGYSDHRGHFVRHFSLCTDQQWMLNQPLSKLQLSSIFLYQTRGVSQAAPHDAGSLRGCLSPENENRCRQCLGPNLKLYDTDKGRKGWIQSKGKSQAKWASVLVSLCSVHGEPSFLFTLRSSALKGRHKGDVSFAGGKSDPSDTDVIATALREAREELGVNVAAENVWGILKPLRDRSGMLIAPVLANLGAIEELSFKPNPGEVEEIFTLSVSHLCNPENRGYTHFRTGDKYGYTLPVFRNGKHRVWGLTAIALDHTLKLLVPQQQVE